MTTSDDDYEDDYVETPEEGYQCLADVFELWDCFREACDPVSQAGALVPFANALFHLRGVMERWGNEANMLPLAASESPDPQRLWELLVDSRRELTRLRCRVDSLEAELAQARAGWPAEEALLLDNIRTAERRANRATMAALSYAAEGDRLRILLEAQPETASSPEPAGEEGPAPGEPTSARRSEQPPAGPAHERPATEQP